jgi:hypothetical protein
VIEQGARTPRGVEARNRCLGTSFLLNCSVSKAGRNTRKVRTGFGCGIKTPHKTLHRAGTERELQMVGLGGGTMLRIGHADH